MPGNREVALLGRVSEMCLDENQCQDHSDKLCCWGHCTSLRPVSCLGVCAEEAEVPGCTPGIDKLFSYRITRLTRLCGDNRSRLLSQRCGSDMPLGLL